MTSIKNFALGALFLSTVAASAQDADSTTSKAVSFGVKGGVNFTTVTAGEDFNSPDSRTSFHVGVLAELPISDMVSIQAEALYSGQGFDLEAEGPDGDDAEVQLDYINVPVLAKVYLFKGFSIEAGPQFSFLVNDEIDLNPNSNDGGIELENRDEPKSFEFGVAGGITFQTEMGLFASGRYNYGVTDIFDDSSFFNDKLNNSVFQISVGYKF